MAAVPKGKLFPLHQRCRNGYKSEYVLHRGEIWSVYHHYHNRAGAERNRDYNNIQAQKRKAQAKRLKKKLGASYNDMGWAGSTVRWAVFPTVMGWSLCQRIEKVNSKHGKQWMNGEPWT